MKTRFGSPVKPLAATGDGWLIVRRASGELREWHISEMILEDSEHEDELTIIDQALRGEITPDNESLT